MSDATVDRQRLLRSLLELDQPIDDLLRALASLGWDSDRELVILQPRHLIGILNRFKKGALSTEEVERWANAIEGRDDIGFATSTGKQLNALLFDLANPSLQGALTVERADEWIGRLREAVAKSLPFAMSTLGGSDLELLTRLQEWYLSECDGDWEHSFGVKIDTLDNPGWIVTIDLAETRWVELELPRRKIDRGDHDWVSVEVTKSRFIGTGGPRNLRDVLCLFFSIVDGERGNEVPP